MRQDIDALIEKMRALAQKIVEQKSQLEDVDILPRSLIVLYDEADVVFSAENVIAIILELNRWKIIAQSRPANEE